MPAARGWMAFCQSCLQVVGFLRGWVYPRRRMQHAGAMTGAVDGIVAMLRCCVCACGCAAGRGGVRAGQEHLPGDGAVLPGEGASSVVVGPASWGWMVTGRGTLLWRWNGTVPPGKGASERGAMLCWTAKCVRRGGGGGDLGKCPGKDGSNTVEERRAQLFRCGDERVCVGVGVLGVGVWARRGAHDGGEVSQPLYGVGLRAV